MRFRCKFISRITDRENILLEAAAFVTEHHFTCSLEQAEIFKVLEILTVLTDKFSECTHLFNRPPVLDGANILCIVSVFCR